MNLIMINFFFDRPGEILVPDSGEHDGGRGICVRNPCPRAHLYFPEPGVVPAGRRHRLDGAGGTCHKVELIVI